MRFLPVVIPIVLAIYCWIELVQSDPREVRALPRWLWAVLILVPVLGAVGWLVLGRPNGEPVGAARRRVESPDRPMAPDDDPDFLRSLKIDPPPEG